MDLSSARQLRNEGAVTIAVYGITRRVYAITSDGNFDIPHLTGSYSITLNISRYTNTTHPVIVGTEPLTLDLTGRRESR